MIFKLAWKNFQEQFRNYLVYFVSMTIAVMVYYCFNSITYNRLLTNRAGRDVHIGGAMNLGSTFLIIMILGFMFSVNYFFLQKRGKELGIYHLIGMRKSQISFLFFVETIILGAFSLVAGIVLGIVFSKLFSMILAKAMFLQVESLFRVSIPSMVQTSIIFVYMLLAVFIQSIWQIYRYRLASLFQINHKKTVDIHKINKLKLILGILGPLLILIGYILSYNFLWIIDNITNSRLATQLILISPLIMLLLCLTGTYLFFKNTLYLLAFIFGKGKRYYYRSLNMIALGNARMHIQRGGNRLAAITILIATTLSMIGGAASVYTIGMQSVNVSDPTDFIVVENQFEQLSQELKKAGTTEISEMVRLNFKVMGGKLNFVIGKGRGNSSVGPVNVLSLSNYREYQKINHYLKRVELKNDLDVVMLDSQKSLLNGLSRYKTPVILESNNVLNVKSIQTDYLGQELMRYYFPTIIVSDNQFSRIDGGVSYTLIALNVKTTEEEEVANRLAENMKRDWVNPLYYEYNWVNGQVEGGIKSGNKEQELVAPVSAGSWQLNYTSRFIDLRYQRRAMGLFIYIAMFLGTFALIMTGSVLMLQQFSEAEKERADYQLLEKMGIPRREITKLIYRQNSLVFFPPMLLGVLHAIFAIYLFSQLIASSGYWIAYLSCGILILIYLAYYLLTSAIYCRIIYGKNR